MRTGDDALVAMLEDLVRRLAEVRDGSGPARSSPRVSLYSAAAATQPEEEA